MITTALPGTTTFNHDLPGLSANAVIYAYTTEKYFYPGHRTPYLFVTNYLNKGNYLLNGKHIQISDKCFYFLNEDDELEINFSKAEPLQTLLILLTEKFVKASLHCITSSHEKLLEAGDKNAHNDFKIPSVPFTLSKIVRDKISLVLQKTTGRDELEIILFDLISEFAILNNDTAKQLKKINAVKRSTQQELYKRLFLAREFINDNAFENLTISQTARQVCLDKFHFLSSFKRLFGITPHQYLTEIKLQKAHYLLKDKQCSVSEVCFTVGFESIGSFSNLFRKRFRVPPSALLNKTKIPNFR